MTPLEIGPGLDLSQPRCEAIYLIARVANRHFDAKKTAKQEWWRIHSKRQPRQTHELDSQIKFHQEMFDEVNALADLVPALGFAAIEDFRQFATESGVHNPKIVPSNANKAITRIADQNGEIDLDVAKSGLRPENIPGLDEPWAGESERAELTRGGLVNLDTLYRLYRSGNLFKLAKIEERSATAKLIVNLLETKMAMVAAKPIAE